MKHITSKDNTFYKELSSLHQKKFRDRLSLFLAEGEKFLQYPEYFSHVIIREDIYQHIQDSLPVDKEIILLSSNLFERLSVQENSQGILVLCPKPHSQPVNSNIIIALEEIKDPGNLGTIIRTMDAAGLKDLFLTKGSVDVYNEKVIRSSMGSIFHINVHYMDLTEMLNDFKDQALPILVTSLDSSSQIFDRYEYPSRFALFFGNESRGASGKLLASAASTLHIPINGRAESLNLAVSAGILIYHVSRI